MRSYLLLPWLVLLTSYALGQYTPTQLPRVAGTVAPSADVSAMARISEVPVNFYTGIPQITYPVFDFSRGSLNLSISLHYFAGGIKVEEMPTSTGLGWTLNSGGMIARTVNGIPDDYPDKGFMYAPAPATSPGNLLDSFYHDKIDAQLDVFQYSFDGHVGKFYLGKNGSILLAPDSKIKVKVNKAVMADAPASTISSFTITTEDGTTYVFSERELSQISGYGDTAPHINKYYVSAWMLSRVIAPFRADSIQFTYDSQIKFYTSRNPEIIVTDPLASNRILQNSTKYTDILLQSKRISRIDLPNNNYVKFIYDTKGRCDFGSDQALRYVEVRDTGLIRGVRLDYQYSTPAGFVSYRPPCTGSEKEKRLVLKQITEYTRGGENPPTIYDYEKDILLPPRDSRSIDFWGFYNGKSNTTLVPPFRDMTGADRNPDFYFMKAGSLRKIIHPSGGYTFLEYENNDNFTIDKDQRSMPYYGDNEVWINVFKLFSNQVGITWKFDNDADRDYFRNLSRGVVKIKITTEDRTRTLFEQTNFAPNLAAGDRFLSLDLPYNGNYIIQLSYSGFAMEDMDRLNFRFSWTNDVVKDDKKATGGLRIKRQIIYDGISHANDVVTEYRYTNEAGKSSGYNIETPVYYYRTGVTADKFYPADVRMSEPINGLTYTQGSPSGYARVEVINGTPERNTGRTVYEFSSFKDLMDGETIPWFYQNYTDVSQFPYVPKDKADWALGLPQVTTAYGPDGRMISKTVNYYSVSRSNYTGSDFRSIKVGVDREIIQNNVRSNNYVYKDYYPMWGLTQLSSTTQTSYYENGSSYSGQTIYEYDNSNLTLRKVSTDYDRSAGLKMVKSLYYPYDYTLAGGIEAMKTAGIKVPIATEVWLEGNGGRKLFSYEATDFQVLGGSVIRPLKSYSLYSTRPLDFAEVPAFNPASLARIPAIRETNVYEVYDSKWNISQLRNLQNGAVSSVIYDDITQAVLAKVTNAAISEIAYTSFESSTKGNWAYTGTPDAGVQAATGKNSYQLSRGNITRTALPAGKNYTLSFWARDGATAVSGGTLKWSELNTATGWTLYRYLISGGAAITISGTARIDELRLHPDYSTMLTTCYDPNTGQTITGCDANNKITWNEYDKLYRIKAVRDQDRNIIKWNEYTAIQPLFKNAPLTNTFTRSCYLGEGTSVSYNIPGGKYTSYISLDDANDQAQEDMRLNGQQYANTNGICTWYNEIQSGTYAKQCTGGGIGSNVVYTVPAKKYSSNISLADANAKALKEIADNGQTKANNEGACMPAVLYIKFTSSNHTSASTVDKWSRLTTKTQNLIVNFYSDAACTVPYSVTNYNVDIKTQIDTQEYMDGSYYNNTSNNTQTYSCNGASFVIPAMLEEEYRQYRKYEGNMEVVSDDYTRTEYFYSIVPNARYIIK
ncbi:DUF5977 domain-containing protein [Chitinophaga sp. 22536]|uniref:DUF5977 domain-containing protein n=1 Tax=unclassified Chitinophaga TaxID=2619133 RepID=UPI003F82EA63